MPAFEVSPGPVVPRKHDIYPSAVRGTEKYSNQNALPSSHRVIVKIGSDR